MLGKDFIKRLFGFGSERPVKKEVQLSVPSLDVLEEFILNYVEEHCKNNIKSLTVKDTRAEARVSMITLIFELDEQLKLSEVAAQSVLEELLNYSALETLIQSRFGKLSGAFVAKELKTYGQIKLAEKRGQPTNRWEFTLRVFASYNEGHK